MVASVFLKLSYGCKGGVQENQQELRSFCTEAVSKSISKYVWNYSVKKKFKTKSGSS
jgi:hypothetical protein